MATGYCVLYRGKTYSLHLPCNSEFAIALDATFVEDKARNGLVNAPYIHSSLEEILVSKLSNAIFNIIVQHPDHKLPANVHDIQGILKSIYGKEPNLYHRIQPSDALELKVVCTKLAQSITADIVLIPDLREDKPMDQILYDGRVSGEEILLPIGSYNVKSESTRELHHYVLKLNDKCKLTVYRVLPNDGKLYNTFYYDVGRGEGRPSPEDALSEGFIVYRDTWTGTVTQVEGLIRLKARFLKTRRITNKKRKAKKRTIKLTYNDIQSFEQLFRNSLEEKYEHDKRILKVLKCKYKVSLSYSSHISYKGEYISPYVTCPSLHCSEKNIAMVTKRCLGLLDSLTNAEKKYIMHDLSLGDALHRYEFHKESWNACKVEEVHILSKFLDQCLKLKAKGAKDGTESNANPSNDSGPTVEVPENRGPTRVVVRTASGYKGVCCGESPVGPTGEDPDHHRTVEGSASPSIE